MADDLSKSRYKSQPPKLDKGLATFATVCAAFVVGDLKRPTRIYKTEIELPCKGLKIKTARVYAVEAHLTQIEAEDWVECFEHYCHDFILEQEERREAAKQAAYNAKFFWSAFCHANDIVPPLDNVPPPSIKDRLNSMSLDQARRTAPWAKGNKLTGDTPLLGN